MIFKQMEPSDGTLIDAIILGQSGLGSNRNEEVLHIPQISGTGASPFETTYSPLCAGVLLLSGI